MTRYNCDQNKVVLLHESGTYAFTSGVGLWPGEVTSHDVEDSEGKIIDHFMGTGRRSFDSVSPGPRDVTGTLKYNPTDMRMLFWAIGSVVDSGTSTTVGYHTVNEIDTNVWQSAFISGTNKFTTIQSFTLEDSKIAPGTGRNFIRTIKGCVPNSVRLLLTQGEKAHMECEYIGQTLYHSSGNTTTIGSTLAVTPYLWNHATLTVAGSVVDTAREITFEINNNLEVPHYINGSRDISTPILGDRDYRLTVMMDYDSTKADYFYSGLFKQNASFNTTLDLNMDSGPTTSGHTILFLSGCKLMEFKVPSEGEGVQEATMEIKPRIVIGSASDMVVKYNPW